MTEKKDQVHLLVCWFLMFFFPSVQKSILVAKILFQSETLINDSFVPKQTQYTSLDFTKLTYFPAQKWKKTLVVSYLKY